MNKYILILFLTGLPAIISAQEIIVQSNNAADYKQYERLAQSTSISELRTKLENVINNNPDYKNTKVLIQVTFFDPAALGSLKLKTSHIHSYDYVDVWKDSYANEDRILFLFEKQNGQYVFKDFAVTQNIDDGQIPGIVAQYIKDRILMSQKSDFNAVIYKGINAIKNAYDRRFQQKMIEHVPKMLMCRYYYKGYTCIQTYSYYFQNTTTNRHADLQQSLVYLYRGHYHDVYLKNWSEISATVFDGFLGHEMLVTDIAILQPELFYAKDGTSYKRLDIINVSFETPELFDYTMTGHSSFEGVSQQTGFNFVEILKNSKSIMSMDLSKPGQLIPILDNGKTIPISHTTLYKLITETIKGPTANNLYNAEDNIEVTNISNEQLWGHPFWTGYPTWCNVFAQYLSRHIYGQVRGDYLVPSQGGTMNANKLFDYFNDSPHYESLPKNDEIWTKYINKGYPVYFSALGVLENGVRRSGHIETGFPVNSNRNIYNKQKFSDSENRNNLLEFGDQQFVVGAGNTVGFKSYGEYKWLQNNNTKAFLALQYLANEYE